MEAKPNAEVQTDVDAEVGGKAEGGPLSQPSQTSQIQTSQLGRQSYSKAGVNELNLVAALRFNIQMAARGATLTNSPTLGAVCQKISVPFVAFDL